jgi:hypothetical protein
MRIPVALIAACSVIFGWLPKSTLAVEPLIRVVVWDEQQSAQGRVFYFRPGYETYPIFKQELPLKIVANAVSWLGTQAGKKQQ